MRRSSAPVLLSFVLAACSSDATDDEVTDSDPDTEVPSDSDDTEVPADTDTEETDVADLPGTPLVLTNPSFEDQDLAPGGDVFQEAPQLKASLLEIPGWTYYLGTAYAGVGVARPTSASFTAVEPLAAPADGTHAAYLDARDGFSPEVGADAHLVHTVAETVSGGDVIHARLAFGSRADVVALHSTVKLQLRIDGGIAAETSVTMPEAGTWTDVQVDYTVPGTDGGHTLALAAIAWQPDLSDGQYWQTWVDNLRVSVE